MGRNVGIYLTSPEEDELATFLKNVLNVGVAHCTENSGTKRYYVSLMITMGKDVVCCLYYL